MLSPIEIAPFGHSGSHISQLIHLSVISNAMITYPLGYECPDRRSGYASVARTQDPYLVVLE